MVHILACVFIVIFILLQDPKGGVLGRLGGGGGGSQTFFGSQGAGGFLVTATKWLALTFALTSITLSYISSSKDKAGVMETEEWREEEPAAPPAEEKGESSDTEKETKPEDAAKADAGAPRAAAPRAAAQPGNAAAVKERTKAPAKTSKPSSQESSAANTAAPQ